MALFTVHFLDVCVIARCLVKSFIRKFNIAIYSIYAIIIKCVTYTPYTYKYAFKTFKINNQMFDQILAASQ